METARIICGAQRYELIEIKLDEPENNEKAKVWNCNQTDLYGAKLGCDGFIVAASGGGVKCTKCAGWFCY